MDWVKWHQLYETEPSRMFRLKLVEQHLSDCINDIPAGAFKAVSICAGDGRDIIGALSGHSRRKDAWVRLVETDQNLVEAGREAVGSAGLAEQMEFLLGDATMTSAYSGMAPADLVVACGVFGNVREQQLSQLVGHLPQLCQAGAYVVWTHYLSSTGMRRIELIRGFLRAAGFIERQMDFSDQAGHLVATHHYEGRGLPLVDNSRMFEFKDPRKLDILRYRILRILDKKLRLGFFSKER